MKHIILILVILLFVFSCDNRTLDPEDMFWAWIHVYENVTLIYDEVLDETDNAELVILPLNGGDQMTLAKFVHILYSDEEDDEEIGRDYIALAERENFFTRFYSCSYQDTIFIDVDGAFSPIPSSVVCGTFFSEDYYPLLNKDFYVLNDTIIVADISTNVFGHFSNDSLAFGNYGIVIKDEFPYGDTLSFNVDGFYKDYFIDFTGE